VIPVNELAAVSVELGPLLMRNPIRDYDWGSLTALARLQGREPSGSPEAELWIGAHPAASSEVVDRQGQCRDLAELIAADPVGLLGAQCLARFGARLPFLTKVLAVDRALSVQVHPDAEQAARGYVREETGGIPPNSALRSYVDPFPKPELVMRLSRRGASRACPDEGSGLLDRLAGRDPAGDVRAAVGARGVVAGGRC
jgi:mannose-6-phosphate isomerase